MLAFAHHTFPLPPLTGAAGTPTAKAHAAAVTEICGRAGNIDEALRREDRYELAVLPADPDFFGDDIWTAQTRDLMWKTVWTTQRLQWLILTRRPDLIGGSLPSNWTTDDFHNVCVGYLADSEPGIAENLVALRDAPVRQRAILLTPATAAAYGSEPVPGIDWVILVGGPEDAPLAASFDPVCAENGAAFLFHQIANDGAAPGSCDGGGPDHDRPVHPFGDRVELLRPALPSPLPGNAAPEPGPTGCPHPDPAPVMADDARHGECDLIEVEVLPSPDDETSSGSNPPAQGRDDEFLRLDAIVRRNLKSYFEAGRALAEIRERELWKLAGHASWAHYCVSIGGLSKQHCNRLILASAIATEIAEAKPVGSTRSPILPEIESQIRPLTGIKDPGKRLEIWRLAVEEADGKPTARKVAAVAVRIAGQQRKPGRKTPVDGGSPALAAFRRLRKAYLAGADCGKIDRLMAKLETLLQSA